MRKLRLIAGGVLLMTLMMTVVSLNTAFVNNANSTDVKSEDLQVVKSVNEVNLLQAANNTEETKVKKDSKKDKIVEKKATKKDKVAKKNKTKKNKTKKKSSYKYVGEFKITAYCPCASCCGKSNGITASGTKATAGRTIAADTSRFPFGTKLKIGDTVYTVEDTGGAINGNRIDMFCGSHSEALQWGVRYLDVYVVK